MLFQSASSPRHVSLFDATTSRSHHRHHMAKGIRCVRFPCYCNYNHHTLDKDHVNITMMPSKQFLSFILLGSLPLLVSSFAAPNKSGWKTRPAVPELQQSSNSDTEKDSARQPWEPLRFVQQSSKFVSMNPFSKPNERVVQPGDVLWSPDDKPTFQLAPLDDVVMGGVSSSTFDNDTGLWKGSVTDANNGGFIGIRSTPAFSWNMEACNGIQLQVKSNSPKTQRFKFITRDSADFNGVSWTSSFDVGGTNGPMKFFTSPSNNGGVTTIKIPFDRQVPTIFARTVPDQVFQKNNVVGVQLAYSKFEYDGDLNPNFSLGDMDLQILEMKAY